MLCKLCGHDVPGDVRALGAPVNDATQRIAMRAHAGREECRVGQRCRALRERGLELCSTDVLSMLVHAEVSVRCEPTHWPGGPGGTGYDSWAPASLVFVAREAVGLANGLRERVVRAVAACEFVDEQRALEAALRLDGEESARHRVLRGWMLVNAWRDEIGALTEWKPKDREPLTVGEMESRHILNSLRVMERATLRLVQEARRRGRNPFEGYSLEEATMCRLNTYIDMLGEVQRRGVLLEKEVEGWV